MLLDVAEALVAADGPHRFSLAEVSRRAGVSVAAPYRHFADREELVAAVATRAYGRIAGALAAGAAGAPTSVEALAGAAAAYVRHAAAHPQDYELLFRSGLDKHAHPEVLRAALEGLAILRAQAGRTLRGDPDGAERLATAVGVAAHGYATLLLDGFLGDCNAAAAQAADEAARAVRALVTGRRHLAS